MKSKKFNNTFVIRLEKGEEIMEVLKKFCKEKNIGFGYISGIGGSDKLSIAYYDLETKKYIPKDFSGKNYEITSLLGNISIVDGEPFLHIHINIGDSEYNSFCGHLQSAVISVTCEIIINVVEGVITREPNDEFKLKLLNL